MALNNVIIVDGKEWPVTLDTNSLIEVEEITGLNLLLGSVNLMLPSFGLLRALLFVSLRNAGAKYKLEDVAAFIDVGNAVDLRDSFIRAWTGDAPRPPDEKRGEGESYEIGSGR